MCPTARSRRFPWRSKARMRRQSSSPGSPGLRARWLDTYETERIGFARRLVATTDRAFSFATADGQIAEIVRTCIVPVVFPRVVALEPVRDYIFRTVSQITLNYRRTPLSAGAAGHVHGGDRLPWVRSESADNFVPLTAMVWQVHVYGAAKPELVHWCSDRNLALHVFPWTAQDEAAGACARCALSLKARYLRGARRAVRRAGRHRALLRRAGTPARGQERTEPGRQRAHA
jgi:hypothetical protein